MITRRSSTRRASAPCHSPRGLPVVGNLINSVSEFACTQALCPESNVAAMLPNEFADASGSVLYKRFACRPKLIRDVKAILKCPWREAVILQGEPTIGKAKLVRSGAPSPQIALHTANLRPALPSELWCRWIAASLQKDFIYVPCTTASTVLRTLKEIIRQLEVRQM